MASAPLPKDAPHALSLVPIGSSSGRGRRRRRHDRRPDLRRSSLRAGSRYLVRVGVCTVTFAYSGAAEQWVVPQRRDERHGDHFGGFRGQVSTSSGSDATDEAGVGGLGGSMRATLPVKAGQTRRHRRKRWQDGVTNSKTPAAGGYGGGAAAGSMVNAPNHGSGGGGGGGSFLFGPSSLLLGTGGGGGGAITPLRTLQG